MDTTSSRHHSGRHHRSASSSDAAAASAARSNMQSVGGAGAGVSSPSTPFHVRTSLHQLYATQRIMIQTIQCIDAWIRHCPSLLTHHPDAADNDTHSSNHGSHELEAELRPIGWKRLTQSIIDLLLRGMQYGSNWKELPVATSPSTQYSSKTPSSREDELGAMDVNVKSMMFHFMDQAAQVRERCLQSMRFILYEAADTTRNIKPDLDGSHEAADLCLKPKSPSLSPSTQQQRNDFPFTFVDMDRLKLPPPSSSNSSAAAAVAVRAVFRGLLSSSLCRRSGFSSSTAFHPDPLRASHVRSSLPVLSEEFYLRQLVAMGHLPPNARLDTHVTWLRLRKHVLVSCIVCSTRPRFKEAGGAGGGDVQENGMGSDCCDGAGSNYQRIVHTHRSVSSPASLLLFVRDRMGMAVYSTCSILQPSPSTTGSILTTNRNRSDNEWNELPPLPPTKHVVSHRSPGYDSASASRIRSNGNGRENGTIHSVLASLLSEDDVPDDMFWKGIIQMQQVEAREMEEAMRWHKALQLESSTPQPSPSSSPTSSTSMLSTPPHLSIRRTLPLHNTQQWMVVQGSDTTCTNYWNCVIQQAAELMEESDSENESEDEEQQDSEDKDDDRKEGQTSSDEAEESDNKSLSVASGNSSRSLHPLDPPSPLPLTSTGLETVRALLSQLGMLTRLHSADPSGSAGDDDGAGAGASNVNGASLRLLRSTPQLLRLVEQLDYGCTSTSTSTSAASGGVTNDPANANCKDLSMSLDGVSNPPLQVAILYRQVGQQSESEMFDNITPHTPAGPYGYGSTSMCSCSCASSSSSSSTSKQCTCRTIVDPAFEKLLGELVHQLGDGSAAAAAAVADGGDNDVEYLVPSRMHLSTSDHLSPSSASASASNSLGDIQATNRSIRRFVASRAKVRVIFSREFSEFNPDINDEERQIEQQYHVSPSREGSDGGGGGGGGVQDPEVALLQELPVVYIVLYPQFGSHDHASSIVEASQQHNINPSFPTSYRVQIVCTRRLGNGDGVDESSSSSSNLDAPFCVWLNSSFTLDFIRQADQMDPTLIGSLGGGGDGGGISSMQVGHHQASSAAAAAASAASKDGTKSRFQKLKDRMKKSQHGTLSNQPNVVHAHMMHATGAGAAAHLSGPGIMSSPQDAEESQLDQLLFGLLRGSTMPSSSTTGHGSNSNVSTSSSDSLSHVCEAGCGPLHGGAGGGSSVDAHALPFLLSQTVARWASSIRQEAQRRGRKGKVSKSLTGAQGSTSTSLSLYYDPMHIQRANLIDSIVDAGSDHGAEPSKPHHLPVSQSSIIGGVNNAPMSTPTPHRSSNHGANIVWQALLGGC